MSVITASPRGRVVLVLGPDWIQVIPREALTTIELDRGYAAVRGQEGVYLHWSILGHVFNYGLLPLETAQAILRSVVHEEADVVWTLEGDHLWTRVPDLEPVPR